MKKLTVILCLLMAFIMLAACGHETDNKTPTQPPISGNDKEQTSDPVTPGKQIEDSDTDYDSLSLFRNVVASGYWTVDGKPKSGKVERKLQYNFFDANNDLPKTYSIVDRMEKLLRDIDTQNTESADEMFDSVNPTPYKAVFSVRGSEQTKEVVFNFKTETDSNGNTRSAIAVLLEDGSSAWLTDKATDEFKALCNQKGLNENNFIISRPITSMFEWFCSSDASSLSPILLNDESKELTALQAAEKLMYEACRELSQPAPNRFFYYEKYEGCNFKLISNKDEKYEDNEYLNIKTLTDDQFIITAIEPIGIYTGIYNDGGPDSYFFMEYTNGQWQLWQRERP